MKRSERRRWFRLALILVAFLYVGAEKQKRQIYREQVLPALGGKIPEEAFRTDRLALNRLNKDGITIPDGVVLDARHVDKHPQVISSMPETIKVYLTPDGRYVPPEGRIRYNHPKSVDTTYVLRTPINCLGNNKLPSNYHKPLRFNKPAQIYGYTKYNQFVPSVPLPVTRPTHIIKPIVAPLVIPTREDLLGQPYFPSWDHDYRWDAIYEPFDDYFINNIALFNSHQIISDYEGFLQDFHDRHLRHVKSNSRDRNSLKTPERGQQQVMKSPLTHLQAPAPYQRSSQIRGSISRNSGYTDLNALPETSFSCEGKRAGMFADVGTKCQVFHDCTDGVKSSFLCPKGTAYSEEKKRCEWWNTVTCNK